MANIDPVVDIDINNLFYQLHETALKEAKSKAKDVDVVNLGVDYSKHTFVGAGDFIIVAQLSKNSNSDFPKIEPDKFKTQCKDALVTYVQIFAGNDAAQKLENDDTAFKPIDEQVAPSSESIARLSLSQLLIEDVPASDNSSKTSCIGYYIQYSTNIEGQKKYRWFDLRDKAEKWLVKGVFNVLKTVASTAATSMFGNVFSDLKSLKMNIGGKDYNIGAPVANALKAVADGTKEVVTIAGQKFIKAFGKTDLEDLISNFTKELHEEFPNTYATPHIQNVDALMTKLRKDKKLDASIQQKLLKNGKIFRMEHIITLDVSRTDPAYESYDIGSLYRCFIDALNETKSFTSLKGAPDLLQRLTSTFSKDDIIKIDGYKSTLKKTKTRAVSVTADSIDTKKMFMQSMLGSLVQLNEDAYADEMKSKIWSMLEDPKDNNKPSESALRSIAHEFRVMKQEDYDKYGVPSAYSAPVDIDRAFRSARTKDDVFKILDAFADEGNIDRLYTRIKNTFGTSAASASSTNDDMYLFCLSNVLRQKDEETKKKVKKD